MAAQWNISLKFTLKALRGTAHTESQAKVALTGTAHTESQAQFGLEREPHRNRAKVVKRTTLVLWNNHTESEAKVERENRTNSRTKVVYRVNLSDSQAKVVYRDNLTDSWAKVVSRETTTLTAEKRWSSERQPHWQLRKGGLQRDNHTDSWEKVVSRETTTLTAK